MPSASGQPGTEPGAEPSAKPGASGAASGAAPLRDPNRGLWLIVAAALALGLLYNVVMLPGFGPDEPRHLRYVQLLWEEHRLPFVLPDGSEYRGAHTLHPPLPYVAMLPLYAIARFFLEPVQYHLLRFFSLACSLAALPLIYQTALLAARRPAQEGSREGSREDGWNREDGWSRSVALTATALCALMPIFGMASGVVNNDASSILAVALFCWLLCVRFGDELSPRRALMLGACFGLGMLCKATVALCDGAALFAFLLARHGWRSGLTWRGLTIVLGVAVATAAPWYGRNFALYGKFSPIEAGYTNPALPAPSNGALVMMMHPNFPGLFARANWGIFYSMWSQKDWFPLAVRTPIYLAFAAAFVLAAVAPLLSRARLSKAEASPEGPGLGLARATRAALYASLAALWLACAGVALFVHWGWAEGGRYLLAALPAMALFLSVRLHLLLPPRVLQVLAWAWGLSLNAIAIYWLLAYLNPTFGPH